MMKVIVDTDVGIDDAMSLAYLPACKNVDIVAITLIAGNEQIDVIAPSIEKIATYLGEKSTPLYIGGRYNLGGKWIQTNGYFGQNGLGGIQLPPQEMKVSKKRSSVEALLHYSRKYPKQIHALFIGPLTNFCLAFLADNEFPSRLASIMIMGTDRSDNTIQNVTKPRGIQHVVRSMGLRHIEGVCFLFRYPYHDCRMDHVLDIASAILDG
ncbi:Uridine nucleosidase 1 [Thelohanellus kitauei]|uniref:Uridine nucleosidase 1 n=1 Tax=Thelohanellus kitauei TaxID=669202 RepID=A0A0C2MQI4_THEKT|nr:Uridine nucleosidase 1 [Thelohanellus kitauei]